MTDDNVRDITFSIDGTWMISGHLLKQAVMTNIGMNSGKESQNYTSHVTIGISRTLILIHSGR